MITKITDKQQPSVDRWLSFGDIITITNEPGPGIESHFARLKGELLYTEKERGGRKVENGVVALVRR